MDRIDKTNTLREILANKKYGIDYYQREYRWGEKQVEQMLEDFRSAFSEYYDPSHDTGEVEHYGYYYMGCLVCAKDDAEGMQIIDGQQRLTTLTILLIYLQKLQQEQGMNQPDITAMISSDSFGKLAFNLDVEERATCFQALIDGRPIESEEESARNIQARYDDIVELFPDELKGDALPLFIYWLVDKVLLLKIETPSSDEAHTIFLTMNDRGLSLNSAEMMKAYLLQKIGENEREEANRCWQDCMSRLKAAAPENINQPDVEFLSTWLRAKYAETLRHGGKNTKDMDYELLGERFHSWVRQNASTKMGLDKQSDYYRFVCEDLPKACDLYLRINRYATTLTEGFESVFYNANRAQMYQTMLILAAVSPTDDDEEVNRKIRTVSDFIDIWASTRILNFGKVNWNTNKHFLFDTMVSIRNKPATTVATALLRALQRSEVNIDAATEWHLNQFTSRYMLHVIARVTSYLNVQMGKPSEFTDYINRSSKQPYDIEHILPDTYRGHGDEFADREEFELWRSHIGNLLILTKDRNRSFQDMPYAKKVDRYLSENIYARSLNAECYENNPAFRPLVERYGFKPYEDFGKEQIRERDELFARIAADIWNPQRIADSAGGVDDEAVLEIEFGSEHKMMTFEYGERSWADAKKFGFLSAETDSITRVPVGTYIFCHVKDRGFCGIGRCSAEAVSVQKFETKDGTPLMEQKWVDEEAKARIKPKKEYAIGIEWIKTIGDDEQGYWEKGLTALPMITYTLGENNETYDKVLEYFNIELDTPEEE